ncbi:MAG: DUF3006 domain-containing protein [Tissierellia bacterium]|nr:DUF3006 domain-containing protein [Tissierellia bacterium]
MKVIIDRFEGDYAIVETEDRIMVNLPKSLVPGAKEGDVVSIIIDEEETKKRKDNINKLMDDLWQ